LEAARPAAFRNLATSNSGRGCEQTASAAAEAAWSKQANHLPNRVLQRLALDRLRALSNEALVDQLGHSVEHGR
jgi:hypothetical protein